MQVVAAEFYNKRFAYYHFDRTTLAPTTTVIDPELGAGFDCEVTDLNNDGVPDVLVTNHEPSGSVFAFEISILPNFTAVTSKHTLASNITIHKSIIPSPGAAAPGEATSFPPPSQVRSLRSSFIRCSFRPLFSSRQQLMCRRMARQLSPGLHWRETVSSTPCC